MSLHPPSTAETAVETAAEAKKRARACGEQVSELLQKHRCRIIPYLMDPEPVGQERAGLLVRAAYAIVPE